MTRHRTSILFGRSALALATSAAFLGLTACEKAVDAGGAPPAVISEDDPLAVPEDLPEGSLDALHRNVIARSCAGQPGLCHSGQFEPNLSTPALTYENLVLRPSLEHKKQLRVAPGDATSSLVIDKLRNSGVISRMPLGADPLPEEEIAAIEAWIADGALRRPGAEPAPALNNPPDEPMLGIFDATGARLDTLGPFVAAPSTTLTFRQSVADFETDDASIPFAAFVLQAADGRQLMVNPGLSPDAGGNLGYATFEASGAPENKGEALNWRWDYSLPETVDLLDPADDSITPDVPTAGLSLTVLAAYADGPLDGGGMLTFSFAQDLVKVEP